MRYFLSILGTCFLISFIYSCGTSSKTSGDIDSEQYYSIVSVNSGKCLDVGDKKENGTIIFQCTCNHSDRQKFKFIEDINENGFYNILNKFSNKNIDIANESKEDGGKIVQWEPHTKDNQKFALLTISGNKYNIISKNSSKLFDVTGQSKEDSIPIIQWVSNGQQNQIFELIIEE